MLLLFGAGSALLSLPAPFLSRFGDGAGTYANTTAAASWREVAELREDGEDLAGQPRCEDRREERRYQAAKQGPSTCRSARGMLLLAPPEATWAWRKTSPVPACSPLALPLVPLRPPSSPSAPSSLREPQALQITSDAEKSDAPPRVLARIDQVLSGKVFVTELSGGNAIQNYADRFNQDPIEKLEDKSTDPPEVDRVERDFVPVEIEGKVQDYIGKQNYLLHVTLESQFESAALGPEVQRGTGDVQPIEKLDQTVCNAFDAPEANAVAGEIIVLPTKTDVSEIETQISSGPCDVVETIASTSTAQQSEEMYVKETSEPLKSDRAQDYLGSRICSLSVVPQQSFEFRYGPPAMPVIPDKDQTGSAGSFQILVPQAVTDHESRRKTTSGLPSTVRDQYGPVGMMSQENLAEVPNSEKCWAEAKSALTQTPIQTPITSQGPPSPTRMQASDGSSDSPTPTKFSDCEALDDLPGKALSTVEVHDLLEEIAAHNVYYTPVSKQDAASAKHSPGPAVPVPSLRPLSEPRAPPPPPPPLSPVMPPTPSTSRTAHVPS